MARETDHRARTGRAFSAVHGVPGFRPSVVRIPQEGGVGARCFGNGQPIVDRCELSAGNDWPDFNLVAVGQDLIFRDEFITPYDQMRLHDEIEFSQQVLGAFRSFDFDLSVRVTQLNEHAR